MYLCAIWIFLFQIMNLFQYPGFCTHEAGAQSNGGFLYCVHTALWLPWAFLPSLRFALDRPFLILIKWTMVSMNGPWPLYLSSRRDTSSVTRLFSLPQEKSLLNHLRWHRHRSLLVSFSVACWAELIAMYWGASFKLAVNQANCLLGNLRKMLTGAEYELAKFTAHSVI